jgi:predicted RNA binding protein YcfA (HicA-like mRNA interferase family)
VYYVRGVPPTFIEDYNNWIKNPFKRTGSRTLYTSTFALFFVSGLSAWIIIEVVLSAKRNEQHLAQQQREQLQREIQQIKLQLEEKNQQTIKLIDQRERGLAELESYRQEQEQNKRELENQIASYESELALKEQQQQETAQTLEDDLQLLWQEWQETSQRESEAKQRSEALNQTIADLKRDRDLIQQQSRQLEQQLETIPNINELKAALDINNELKAALEGARTELDRTKEQSRDWEKIYVEEMERLEKEKVQLNSKLDQLNSELYSSKSKTQFLEDRKRQLEWDLSAAQENTQTLENTIEYLNVELQNMSQNSHSATPWSQLPRISGREAIGSLERLGFRRDRQNGGHVVLERVRVVQQIDSCTVPIHDELDSGTLAGILRQANVTLEDFLDNLRSC